MNVTVIGTGYVGLVSGTCFAEHGHRVTCVDVDASKVARMQKGEIPIFEPGLEELFLNNIQAGRLHFTTNLATGIDGAQALFLALPTPEGEDGSADLSYVLGVAEQLGPLLKEYVVVVNKSTVPVGTAGRVHEALAKHAPAKRFDVVSNPEFLREGQAVLDFMEPDRIVVGTTSPQAIAIMSELYEPFTQHNPEILMVTDPASAEIIKYASNAFLATKITFANELAAFAEAAGADIHSICKGMGLDPRIGGQFLSVGPGYGGSCFPKDTKAVVQTAREHGVHLSLVTATIEANDRHQKTLPEMVSKHFKGRLKGKKFALWGLAFKGNTDDIRYSPALSVIDELTAQGAHITAYDPQAAENTRRARPNLPLLSYAEDAYKALKDADALIIATEWKEFHNPEFDDIKKLLKQPVIFDGRNLYEPKAMHERGFYYASIGRRAVDGRPKKQPK